MASTLSSLSSRAATALYSTSFEHHSFKKSLSVRRVFALLQVQGVPTSRLIIGKREIDVYRNGLMFERDHVVGVFEPW
jgi:hypothetical protein